MMWLAGKLKTRGLDKVCGRERFTFRLYEFRPTSSMEDEMHPAGAQRTRGTSLNREVRGCGRSAGVLSDLLRHI